MKDTDKKHNKYEECAEETELEHQERRLRKKRERMPIHGAALKNTKLQEKRSIQKLAKVLRKK